VRAKNFVSCKVKFSAFMPLSFPPEFSTRIHHIFTRSLLVGLSFGVSGCVSTIALDRAVMAYDRTVVELVSKQLPLNIARARHNQPIHFTAISNIAATYNFGFSASATPALTGDSGSLLAPIFGASVVENPTISITPMQGGEFTEGSLCSVYFLLRLRSCASQRCRLFVVSL
jgi:hypothetical protein